MSAGNSIAADEGRRFMVCRGIDHWFVKFYPFASEKEAQQFPVSQAGMRERERDLAAAMAFSCYQGTELGDYTGAFLDLSREVERFLAGRTDCAPEQPAGAQTAITRLRAHGERTNDGKNNGTIFRFADGGTFFLADIDAALAESGRTTWRCFHCDETFDSEHAAHIHFGCDETRQPGCIEKVAGGELGLLTRIRELEQVLIPFLAETSAVEVYVQALRADHAIALRREEERGYDKGLADGLVSAGTGGAEIERLVDLVEELCDAVDAGAADIGGTRDSLTILREIGPLIAPSRAVLASKGEPQPVAEGAGYRRGVEHQRARITARERRRVVAWLHERANTMGDQKAKAILDLAADALGKLNARERDDG